MFQAIIYISSEQNVDKNKKNKLFPTVSSWFDLAVTLKWPYHDLGITPLWYQTPTDITMCTWLEFRPSYITHSNTTLRVKVTILQWPLVTLSMHRKSADHLKVTWYMVRLKKIWSTKIPRGGGGRLSVHGLKSRRLGGRIMQRNLDHLYWRHTITLKTNSLLYCRNSNRLVIHLDRDYTYVLSCFPF